MNFSITTTNKEIGGQQYDILNFNGVEYIKLADVKHLLDDEENDTGSEIQSANEVHYGQKLLTLNGKQVNAYVVNGDLYLTMQDIAAIWGGSISGLSVRFGTLEKEICQALEKKREQEIAQTGHSDINPEQDSKLRHQFQFDKKKRFVKISDVNRYFFNRA